jgi:hypothetical protein
MSVIKKGMNKRRFNKKGRFKWNSSVKGMSRSRVGFCKVSMSYAGKDESYSWYKSSLARNYKFTKSGKGKFGWSYRTLRGKL